MENLKNVKGGAGAVVCGVGGGGGGGQGFREWKANSKALPSPGETEQGVKQPLGKKGQTK